MKINKTIITIITIITIFIIIGIAERLNDYWVEEYTPTSIEKKQIVVSNYGFTFTPPEGWKLWQALSAGMENVDNPDRERIQVHVATWRPEDSMKLVYTNANVDTRTRDINSISNISINTQFLNKIVTFQIREGMFDTKQSEINTSENEVRYVETEWGRGKYMRGKYESYDDVTLKITINSEYYIGISSRVEKTTGDFMPFFNNFLNGLDIHKNTFQ